MEGSSASPRLSLRRSESAPERERGPARMSRRSTPPSPWAMLGRMKPALFRARLPLLTSTSLAAIVLLPLLLPACSDPAPSPVRVDTCLTEGAPEDGKETVLLGTTQGEVFVPLKA